MEGRWWRRRALVVAVVAVVVAALGACSDASSSGTTGRTTTSTTSASTRAASDTAAGAEAVVTSVTDGDTIRVTGGSGDAERVRLIGIDTPETHDPRTVVECFGKEAAAHTATLVPTGTRVRLVQDVEARDRYGRLLAYVYRLDDGLFVNEELVADGWAVPYRYPPNVRFADHFSALGRQAREHGLGLWGACGGANTPAAGATATATAAAPPVAAGSAGACDPNYAGACVPLSSSDLDCGDVGVRRFQVVGSDPHGFDGDHDGFACE